MVIGMATYWCGLRRLVFPIEAIRGSQNRTQYDPVAVAACGTLERVEQKLGPAKYTWLSGFGGEWRLYMPAPDDLAGWTSVHVLYQNGKVAAVFGNGLIDDPNNDVNATDIK